jgi:hypothetical protein
MFRRGNRQKAKGNSQKSKNKLFFLLPIAYFLLPIVSNAQCAMCRAALESDGNAKQAEAVNDGIVYLMIIPYVIAAVIGFAVYKMFNKNK